MASTIKIKRSAVPNTPPITSNLELGELAINTYDGKLYLKKNVSGIETVVEIGSGGTSPSTTNWVKKTTNYTASNGDKIIADTTAGTFTITLPVSPTLGHSITIADGGNWATTNLIVARNSSTIESTAEDITLDIKGIQVELVYDGATWEVYAFTGPSSIAELPVQSGNSGKYLTTNGSIVTWDTPVISINSLTGVITAANLLDAIKTVDGIGSGLDANLLEGNSAATFYLATNPSGYTSNTGTVTSVTATAPVSSSGGTTPVISMAAATTLVSGYLTTTDWDTFNNKQPALGFTPYNATNPSGYTSNTGTVTSVTATAPVSSSGGTTPVISMAAATTLVSGYLTTTDWDTFNNKQPAGTYATGTGTASGTNTGDQTLLSLDAQATLVSGTNIKTINGTTLLGSGDIVVSSTIRSTTITSASTITPASDSTDQYTITALAVPASIAIPTGTPVDGQRLTIRIEDNLTPQALTWVVTTGGYRVIGTTLPTTTVSGKTVYIGCIYNINDGYWDVVSVAQQA